jgi:Mg2+/Co2+ transporter CorB
LEEIVGEFNLDFLSKSSKFNQDEDGGWIVDGSVTIRTLNKKLNLQFPIDGPKTLNGLVLEYFGYPGTEHKLQNCQPYPRSSSISRPNCEEHKNLPSIIIF